MLRRTGSTVCFSPSSLLKSGKFSRAPSMIDGPEFRALSVEHHYIGGGGAGHPILLNRGPHTLPMPRGCVLERGFQSVRHIHLLLFTPGFNGRFRPQLEVAVKY
jgi:hypothetical protein